MIKCSRCGTPIIQEPDGTLRKGCACLKAPLVMISEYPFQVGTSALTSAYPLPISDTPTIEQGKAYDPRDYARAEHLDTMSKHMEEHELTCVSCSYFKYYGFYTRCVEYRNMQELQAFWRKRIKS